MLGRYEARTMFDLASEPFVHGGLFSPTLRRIFAFIVRPAFRSTVPLFSISFPCVPSFARLMSCSRLDARFHFVIPF